MESNKPGTSGIWLLGGFALGAAFALLIATETGEGTRRKLATQAQRGRKALSESGQDILDQGRDLYLRGRELAEEAADMFERSRQIAEKKIVDYI